MLSIRGVAAVTSRLDFRCAVLAVTVVRAILAFAILAGHGWSYDGYGLIIVGGWMGMNSSQS